MTTVGSDGAIWGRSAYRPITFHRLSADDFGDQVGACGERLAVVEIYYCDPKRGAAAAPVICAVCPACRLAQQERILGADGAAR